MSVSGVFASKTSFLEEKKKIESLPTSQELASFISQSVRDIREVRLSRYSPSLRIPEARSTTIRTGTRAQVLRWGPDVRVYLGSKDPSVREVERSFRQHLKWDFEENRPVRSASKKTRPPTLDNVIFGFRYLCRHFKRVEKENGGVVRVAVDKPDEKCEPAKKEGAVGHAKRREKELLKRDVTAPEKKSLPYKVTGTKKGTIPVVLEKRKHGKTVTVIRNVHGDAKKLLVEMKHVLGTGGSVVPMRDESKSPKDHARELKQQKRSKKKRGERMGGEIYQVEIQGDHLKRVSAFLRKKGGFKGVRAASDSAKSRRRHGNRSNTTTMSDADDAGKSVDRQKKKIHPDMPDLSKPLDNKTVKTMKPTVLKLVLKARGLSTQGSKKELIKRVLESNA